MTNKKNRILVHTGPLCSRARRRCAKIPALFAHILCAFFLQRDVAKESEKTKEETPQCWKERADNRCWCTPVIRLASGKRYAIGNIMLKRHSACISCGNSCMRVLNCFFAASSISARRKTSSNLHIWKTISRVHAWRIPRPARAKRRFLCKKTAKTCNGAFGASSNAQPSKLVPKQK